MFGMKQVANDNGITAKVGPAQPQQQAQPGTIPEGAEPATPEEQAIYDEVVENSFEMMTTPDRQIQPAIAAGLQGELPPDVADMFAEVQPPLQKTPIDNIAATAVQMVLFLDAAATDAGKNIPDDVLYHVGSEVIENLAETARTAGIHDYSEQEMEGAFYRALDMFRQVSPRVDPDALGEQFAVVANADGEGKLTQLMPTIAERLAA